MGAIILDFFFFFFFFFDQVSEQSDQIAWKLNFRWDLTRAANNDLKYKEEGYKLMILSIVLKHTQSFCWYSLDYIIQTSFPWILSTWGVCMKCSDFRIWKKKTKNMSCYIGVFRWYNLNRWKTSIQKQSENSGTIL